MQKHWYIINTQENRTNEKREIPESVTIYSAYSSRNIIIPIKPKRLRLLLSCPLLCHINILTTEFRRIWKEAVAAKWRHFPRSAWRKCGNTDKSQWGQPVAWSRFERNTSRIQVWSVFATRHSRRHVSHCNKCPHNVIRKVSKQGASLKIHTTNFQ
jgi:hypothetical protein